MALSDWIFYTRVTPPVDPPFVTQIVTPGLIGTNSLRVTAQDDFATGVLAGSLNATLYPIGYAAGQIECSFRKGPGTNQREHGIFCLSSLADPTANTAKAYVILVRDGPEGQIQVYKCTNGLFDASSATLLRSYTVGGFLNNQNQLVSLRVKWLAGLFALNTASVRLQLWYGINLEGLAPQRLTPDTVDTTGLLYTGMREGFFVRTQAATELIDSYFDNLRISRVAVQNLGG